MTVSKDCKTNSFFPATYESHALRKAADFLDALTDIYEAGFDLRPGSDGWLELINEDTDMAIGRFKCVTEDDEFAFTYWVFQPTTSIESHSEFEDEAEQENEE